MVLTAQNCQCIFQRNRLEQISFNFLSKVLPCGTAWARHRASGSPTYCFFSVRNHGMVHEWNVSSDMPSGRQTSCLSVEDKGLQPGEACSASVALCGVLGRGRAWAAAVCGPQPCAPHSALWLNGRGAGSVIVHHGQLPHGSYPNCFHRLCGPVLIIIFTCCMESSCCLWFNG